MKIISGDLIALAKQGHFDVIAHGCNCFCTMGAGIAKQMAEHFGADDFPMERNLPGSVNKLGQIDYSYVYGGLIVANCYTQYKPGRDLNLSALELCLYKINSVFANKRIGLPLIGCGIAGGDEGLLFDILKSFNNKNITVVKYESSTI